MQLKWYSRLEKSGFKDIERTGKNKHKHFDPYTPYLQNMTHHDRNRLPETFEHYQSLRNLSHDAIVAPNSTLNNTDKPQKLHKLDKQILFMYGDGKSYEEISKYLRRYYHKQAKRRKRGPKGKGFSVFWCFTRLQKLLKCVKLGEIYSDSKYLGADEDSEVGTDLASPPKPLKGGGVKKASSADYSSIYIQNNKPLSNNENPGEEE